MQGSLDLREFTAAVRKQGHISSKTASEREVQVLFDMVDLDKSGQLSLSEWYLFLGLTKDGVAVVIHVDMASCVVTWRKSEHVHTSLISQRPEVT